LAASALLCATLSGFVVLVVQQQGLDPADGAYGQSPWLVLNDPFVLRIWVTVVLAGAALCFACALLTLWRANLGVAIPVVFAVTVGSAAAAASVFVPMSVPVALVMGLATMSLFRAQPASPGLRARPVAK